MQCSGESTFQRCVRNVGSGGRDRTGDLRIMIPPLLPNAASRVPTRVAGQSINLRSFADLMAFCYGTLAFRGTEA